MSWTTQSIRQQFGQDREATFRRLYEEVFPSVAKVIAGKGGNLADAKDIFQEAMIIYYEGVVAEKIELRHSPAAYVKGIARKLWAQQCRKRSSLDHLPGWQEAGIAARQTEEQQERKAGHSLLDYLRLAGQKCMDLLQAFYYHKHSMKEIAEEFGFRTERSATVQKYKCLERVREKAKQASDAKISA